MIGRTVAQFTIVARLGEGATGEVYQARHGTLHHLVAIKFLRPDLMRGEAARARFLREARLAAALDCPSICNVIDFGEIDGRAYIVMRYCAGENLRELLAGGPLPVARAVLLAIQIGEGLAAAHAQQIVHRDIKPSNIVIAQPASSSGVAPAGAEATTVGCADRDLAREQAKIVDFGLAMLPEQTRLTAAGGLVGTPAYMAPEQITGAPLDRRTDLWALGAVLHEMVTGRPPFAGETASAVMHAIVHSVPWLVSHPDPAVPAKLVWIIEHALQKDPARRYSDARAMLDDLRRLHRDLQAHARDLPSWIVARRRWLVRAALGAVCLAVVLLAVGILRSPASGRSGLPQGHPVAITAGDAFDAEPALSPDGSRIAYTSRVVDQADIYVVSAQGGPSLRLTDDPRDDYAPAWFPDGASLAFVSERLGRPDIWKTDQLGGGCTLLLADARDPAVAPDGRRLAFVRDDSLGLGRIGVVDLADPAGARSLTGPGDGLWDHRHPAWSPDGKLICYSTKDNLWLLDPQSGATRPLTRDGRDDREPCWSPDGRHVYFTSHRDNVGALWRIRLGASLAERLTLGAGEEGHPSLAAGGGLLAYSTRSAGNQTLMIEDLRGGDRVRFEGQHNDSFPSLTPDGRRLAFVSDRWGERAEVWLQDLAAGRPQGSPRRLTEQPGHASHTAISPDGAWVAYYRFLGAERDIWIVAAAGGEPQRITDDPATDAQPSWSPDASRLAFISDRSGWFAVWIVPITQGRAAGSARRLTPDAMVATVPIWSPDGTQVAFTSAGELWVIDADGRTAPRALTSGAAAERLRWEPGTGGIWLSGRWGRAHFSLREVDPQGGTPIPVAPHVRSAFANQHLFFDVADGGGVLAWAVDNPRGRIWLLRADGGVF